MREAGIEVLSVREMASGIKDEAVIQMALEYDYIVLTEDKDFGEWIFAHHIKDLSVLFLRYSYPEFKEIAHTIAHLLKTQTIDRPFFATVTTKKIRIRKL